MLAIIASGRVHGAVMRGHHREVHRCGDEASWWKKAGIDPATSDRFLWLETHPLPANSKNRDAGDANPSGTTWTLDFLHARSLWKKRHLDGRSNHFFP